MSSPVRLGILRNPVSGRGAGRRWWREIEADLGDFRGARVTVVETVSSETVAQQARELAAVSDVVAAAGGDGTLSGVLAGVLGTDAALAIIPLGTGNDFARTLGLHNDLDKAIYIAAHGTPIATDAIRWTCGGREGWMLNVGGAGFDAVVARRINEGFRFLRGTAAYLAAVAASLAKYRPVEITATLDGDTVRGPAMLVAVANAQSYGGGMKIAPTASIDDGLLDVVTVGDVGPLEFVRQFPKVFRGAHLGHPKVSARAGRHLVLESARPIPVLADGELIGDTPATFELVPGAVRIMRP